MHPTPSHPKALEEIEKTTIPGLVEVLHEEGLDGVRYDLREASRLLPSRLAQPGNLRA